MSSIELLMSIYAFKHVDKRHSYLEQSRIVYFKYHLQIDVVAVSVLPNLCKDKLDTKQIVKTLTCLTWIDLGLFSPSS